VAVDINAAYRRALHRMEFDAARWPDAVTVARLIEQTMKAGLH